ncbi:NUDIX domain-containing protein [Actinomadura fulvescens]|uniref:NUDIX domain-containing protein n=1 Tax=Actinomadura fulvescens TaxID=46160 RepID=A0ABP6C2R2_9ACTN
MRHSHDRERVAVTVDLVIFTVRDERLHVLLIERGKEPFEGRHALPGGYVRAGEHLDAAARRELVEETGVDAGQMHLEQFRTYGDPERDPRGRVITVAYLALGPDMPVARAGTDARAAGWEPVDAVLDGRIDLAFDHGAILREGLERARSQLEYTTVAATFCREPFTIAELRQVYEVVWGLKLDASNFRRKVTKARGFLVATGAHRTPDIGRPAGLYRRGDARLLTPPLLRSGDAVAAQLTTLALR